MAAWRVWFWSIFIVLVIAASALFAGVWNNLSNEWSVETSAAQFALNESPLVHIDAHDVFTAADVQESFFGTDTFGRKWYAFVYGSPFVVHTVPASDVLSKENIVKKVALQHITPREVHLGYLDQQQQERLHTESNIVYEVVGSGPTGGTEYVYIDAKTGKVAWKYVLST